MKLIDLKKGDLYAIQCPINNYAYKPFIFNKIEFCKTTKTYKVLFFGIESPNLTYPVIYFTNRKCLLKYGTIKATPISRLEAELL